MTTRSKSAKPSAASARSKSSKSVLSKQATTARRPAIGVFLTKAGATKVARAPSVAIVDGYKVYRSALEPVHITREQIAKAIAAVK